MPKLFKNYPIWTAKHTDFTGPATAQVYNLSYPEAAWDSEHLGNLTGPCIKIKSKN